MGDLACPSAVGDSVGMPLTTLYIPYIYRLFWAVWPNRGLAQVGPQFCVRICVPTRCNSTAMSILRLVC